MRKLLRDTYAQDPENGFLGRLSRSASDPAMPRDANNRHRIHPLWLTFGLFVLLVVAAFFYFSFAK